MEQDPSSKRRVAQLTKEIVILCNRKIHYRVESSLPFVPILSQINPIFLVLLL